MCGPNSAFGLAAAERSQWPYLRERLRQPGASMGLMRAVLGGESEVAVVVATSAAGISAPVAILVTPEIAGELRLPAEMGPSGGISPGHVGSYDVDVIYDAAGAPVAILISDWIFHNLAVYARKLWSRH